MLLGAGLDSNATTALKALCDDRELLIEVAKAAHGILEIQATPIPECAVFESTAASLKGELEQGGKKTKTLLPQPKREIKVRF